LFEAFDENCDGQLDLAEMVRAVGWSCRSSPREKHNLCFKIFDEDRDGALSREELTGAITHLQTIVRENSEETPEDIEDIVSSFGTVLFLKR
jgi:Ca2+-binding EF-hand superfamily protein